MHKRSTLFLASLALAGNTVISSYALADKAQVITAEGDTMVFEYEADKLRIDMPGNQQGYMLMRDNKLYVVAENNGQIMVFDMASAIQMFGNMAQGATPEVLSAKIVSLDATGTKESVAGIDGEIYQLTFIDNKGVERSESLVLSSNALAIAFRDIIQAMSSAATAALQDSAYQNSLDAADQIHTRLSHLNMGVLRYGRDIKIQSIEDTTVADERFILPAPPTDLGALIGAAMKNSGNTADALGTLLGGAQSSGGSPDNDMTPEQMAESLGKMLGN
ncbi:MAG: hypothetical protein ACK5ME_06455 [Parahaliea sp.]